MENDTSARKQVGGGEAWTAGLPIEGPQNGHPSKNSAARRIAHGNTGKGQRNADAKGKRKQHRRGGRHGAGEGSRGVRKKRQRPVANAARGAEGRSRGAIRVLSLNVNGLRQERKVKALGAYLASLSEQPDICILVETHLLEHETDKIVLDTYKKAHESCREFEVEQACGGVLIMVKHHVRYRKMDEVPGVALPLNSCSILVFLYARDIPALRVTGAYFPPSARPTTERAAMLTDHRSTAGYRGETIGHLICGDLNHPSWLTQYEEWVGEAGLMELTNPELGTFASGNSLDKFLFLPGADTPTSFFMEGVEGDDAGDDAECYPGETGEEEVVGNHHPICLRLP